jgi:hypothetical protein
MKKPLLGQGFAGSRGGETRTHDLFDPNEARYQLRYTPKFERTQR